MGEVAIALHADEVAIDEGLVRELLAEQFTTWARLPLERVRTPGSDHVLFRLGDELVVRLPRMEGVEGQVDKERTWLPHLAPRLSAAVPAPVAKGRPSSGYPFVWSVYEWLAGENPSDRNDGHELAEDLARFVVSLQSVDTVGGPTAGVHNSDRGVPLARRDEHTRAAIVQLGHELDADRATAAWEQALHAPAWQGSPVWLHGDLTPENLLVDGPRLAAVIDWGCLGIGDPACDLMAAWSVLAGSARETFRAALGVDDATWSRGRGWALSTALIALPYYAETHPPRAENARRCIAEVLAETEHGAR